jgi:FkbH-like protein
MKLTEALEVLRRPVAETAPESKIFLGCGFTPLHLQTFLAAELRALFSENRISVKTGLFGDLHGNIERLEPAGVDSLAVVIEWGDLDPRLALRTLGGWRPADLSDIVESAIRTAARLQRALTETSRHVHTVVCMPTLPLPPMFVPRPDQAGYLEMQLRQSVASFLMSLSQQPGLRIANTQFLDEISPLGGRYDVKSDVLSGFPYSLPHASAIAKLLACLIQNRPPKKGLITDLDDTLWAGILGEDGVDGISWHLDQHTHMHGLYQQFVSSLAGAGVLIGVASKNDPAIVGSAFARSDMLISKNDIFPFETHWSRKSESVHRILKTWNVGEDSVVFIDDSPMEVAEVKAAFPEMECIVFPKSDYQSVWNLLKHLRELFGKPSLMEDDALRLHSIREAGEWRDATQSPGSSAEEFLKTAEACMVFEPVQPNGDARAFELINKTNQFNLNGKRFNESEWRNFFSDPAAFVLTVSYKDKFGPLGKIAVIMGKSRGDRLCVTSWVMSCRAFSRRIEHQCLKYLFETRGAEEIGFDYQATDRNGPLQEFFAELLGGPAVAGVCLSREQFAARVPALFHRVKGTVNV